MPKKLFRVRFQDPSEKKTVEVVVEDVEASEIIGLVRLDRFVFNDNKKLVILPEEDAARQRFGKTETLHIPYHSIIFVEEFEDEPADLRHLPFVREVLKEDAGDKQSPSSSSQPRSPFLS